jgi:hypothetical protein
MHFKREVGGESKREGVVEKNNIPVAGSACRCFAAAGKREIGRWVIFSSRAGRIHADSP